MPHPDQVSTDNLRNVARQLGGWLDPSAAEKFRAAGRGAVPLAESSDVPGSSSPGAADAASPPRAFELPAFELGESFALYSLGAEDIENGLLYGADLTKLARATERWHHQVKVDKKPVGFARSTCKGDADFEVQQIYLSELARYVDEAITWIDRQEEQNPGDAESDPVVRLLVVPVYQVHAFWLCKPGADVKPYAAASNAATRVGSGAWPKGGESHVLVIDAPRHLDGLRPDTLLGSKEFLEAFRGKEQFGGLTFT